MYYGNSSGTAASNATNTFIFFDDFETGVGAWTEVSPGTGRSCTQSSAQSQHGTYSMYIDDNSTASTYGVYATFPVRQTGKFVVDYYAQPVQNTRNVEMQLRDGTGMGPELRFSNTAAGSDLEYKQGGSWLNMPTPMGYSGGNWYSFMLDEINSQGSPNDLYDVWVTSNQKADNIRFQTNRTGLDRIYFISGTAAETPKIYIDMVKVRAYATTVPAYSFGTEE
jgi:hypothetical protein